MYYLEVTKDKDELLYRSSKSSRSAELLKQEILKNPGKLLFQNSMSPAWEISPIEKDEPVTFQIRKNKETIFSQTLWFSKLFKENFSLFNQPEQEIQNFFLSPAVPFHDENPDEPCLNKAQAIQQNSVSRNEELMMDLCRSFIDYFFLDTLCTDDPVLNHQNLHQWFDLYGVPVNEKEIPEKYISVFQSALKNKSLHA